MAEKKLSVMDCPSRGNECCDQPKAEGCSTNKTPTEAEIQAEMNRTFHTRRKYLTQKHPRIAELKRTWPNLFKGRQILREFKRITDIDIDSALEYFCGHNSAKLVQIGQSFQNEKVLEMIKYSASLKDNPSYLEYWDMVTSLCILPELMNESSNDLVNEVPKHGRVDPEGIIVPTLVTRGSVFDSCQFVLVIEQERVAIYNEFTLAIASLFASFWVFNMMFPPNLAKTFSFMQNVMVGIKDNFPMPKECRHIQQLLGELKRSITA